MTLGYRLAKFLTSILFFNYLGYLLKDGGRIDVRLFYNVQKKQKGKRVGFLYFLSFNYDLTCIETNTLPGFEGPLALLDKDMAWSAGSFYTLRQGPGQSGRGHNLTGIWFTLPSSFRRSPLNPLGPPDKSQATSG